MYGDDRILLSKVEEEVLACAILHPPVLESRPGVTKINTTSQQQQRVVAAGGGGGGGGDDDDAVSLYATATAAALACERLPETLHNKS